MADTKKKAVLKNRLNVLGKRAKTLAKVGVVAATLAVGAKAEARGFVQAPSPVMSYGGHGYSHRAPAGGYGYAERPQYFGRGVRGGQQLPGRMGFGRGEDVVLEGLGGSHGAPTGRRQTRVHGTYGVPGGAGHMARGVPGGTHARRAPAAPRQHFRGGPVGGPQGSRCRPRGGGRRLRPQGRGCGF